MGRQWSRALVAGLLVAVSIWGCSDDDGGSLPGEPAGEAGSPAAGAGAGSKGEMAEGGVGGRAEGGVGGRAEGGAGIIGGQPERAGQSSGGAGGAGGDSSSLPPLEWCDGVDQIGLSLDALCSEQDCPALVTPSTEPAYYANLETHCYLDPRSDSNVWSAKRYGSTCGGFALDVPYPAGRIIWHFDESRRLVAAEIRLLNYDQTPCHTESYGRSCETTGAAVNVCDPDSHCAQPLAAVDQPTRQQVLCDLLCDGSGGYRIPNDCGGMNYVRHDGRVDSARDDDPEAFTRTWSFDAQNQLVGAYGRGFGFSGFCADGAWALGVTYGEPCPALDPYAYGSSAYDVCQGVGPYSGEANGEGGAGGAGDESRYWTNGSAPLEEAELCGVDCAPTDLATYCSAAGSYCPQVNVDGYGVEAACGDAAGTTVGDASCGHVIDALGDGKTRVYYFDDQWQLVGAKLTEEPRRLGAYCKTQVVGEQCTPQGTPLDICWKAGCLPPNHQVPTFADVSQCPVAYSWQVPNDCGGINITRTIPGERGSELLWSFDADHQWLGTRSFFVEDGFGLHDCAEGGIGAGYLDGTLCKSVGDPTPLCP